MIVLLAAVSAFVVAAVTTPIAARVARRTGIVDRPGPLKLQRQPIPYLGGVAVLAGIIGPVAASRAVLLVPLVAAAAVGLADDARDIRPTTRLVLEVVVGVLVAVLIPTRLDTLGGVLVVATTVATINAVNLLDGLDGLATATVAVAAAVLAAPLDGDERLLAAAVAGAAAGFLVHNRPPASIYLGDAGSYLLGTALSVLVAATWDHDRSLAVGVGALAAVAVPTVELVTTVLRRGAARLPLFEGDRSHLYDRLRRRGWMVATIAVVYAASQAVIGTVAYFAARYSTAMAVAVVCVGFVAVTTATVVLGRGDDRSTRR